MNQLRDESVQLSDIRIAYRQNGNGPALLLLHGNSGSKAIFNAYQTRHFPMFHTFALDSRGHGSSRSRDEAYAIEQFSQDVIDFCGVKGIQQASVIGYSDGGNIALWLAHKAPQTFPRIVAISPNTLVSGITEDGLRLIQKFRKRMDFFHRLGFRMKKQMMRFDLMLADIGLGDEQLRGIQSEVRILYAENDMIREEHILHLGASIPHASVEKIMGCDHLTIFQKPEAIASMQNFLLRPQ